jgi:hypothetical protein
MRAIWEVTSSKLLTKQAMRKTNCKYIHAYILKLPLKIVISEIKALVIVTA